MQFTTLLFSGLCRFVNRIARDHIDEISRTMSLWHCLNDFLVFLDAHACTQKNNNYKPHTLPPDDCSRSVCHLCRFLFTVTATDRWCVVWNLEYVKL